MTNLKSGHYLTVGLSGVVLRDIVGIMKSYFPDLFQIKAESAREAEMQVADAGTIRFAFLNLAPNAVLSSDLSAKLNALHTKIILMGGDAEDAAEGSPFDTLIRPFAQDDIMCFLTPS